MTAVSKTAANTSSVSQMSRMAAARALPECFMPPT
jgi:hypothetical protein